MLLSKIIFQNKNRGYELVFGRSKIHQACPISVLPALYNRRGIETSQPIQRTLQIAAISRIAGYLYRNQEHLHAFSKELCALQLNNEIVRVELTAKPYKPPSPTGRHFSGLTKVGYTHFYDAHIRD